MNQTFRSTKPDALNRTRARASTTLRGATCLAGWGLVAAVTLAFGSNAAALPADGVVAAGTAKVTTGPASVTVTQSSQNVVINWQSFGIGQGEAVQFQQPNSNSVALNRVVGADPSAILGSLSANGKVFLVNPNGILFAPGAEVNVAGLVASTLDISDANFMAGRYKFTGAGPGKILNQGSINADGGYVALLGADVSNEGVISARLGTVVLAAGRAVTIDVAGDGLLNVSVDEGAVNALVNNGGVIRAHGGQVVMTAKSAGQLIRTAVNNTGVIEAQTVDARNGTIKLLGDMQNGDVNVTGTLDASAPRGGDGGFIETSAAQVNIAPRAKITTLAIAGATGTWLIDPVDFTIGAGGNISGATLSALLVTNSVVISTTTGPDTTVAGTPPTSSRHTAVSGNGDIQVNEAIAWTAAPSTTTLTLNADRDVNVNAAITATNGNLVVCCGRDINVGAAITTTNGSVLLNAGRQLSLSAVAAMSTTDGNIGLCAAADVTIAAAITLTRGSSIPAQSLGLSPGLLINAGYGANGPGVAGGTLNFAPLAPRVTVTGPNAPVVINYNPPTYASPVDFAPKFVLTNASLTQHMLLYPTADKVFDGTTAATLTGFKSSVATGAPTGVTLVAGAGSTAVFDTASVGTNTGITFSGYSLAGASAGNYAFAASCCTAGFKTSANITAAAVTPPVVTPPVVTPPVVTPPVVTPPVVTPPVVTPPVVTPPVVTPPTSTTPPVVPTTSIPVSTTDTTSTLISLPVLSPLLTVAAAAPDLTVVRGGVRTPPRPALVVEAPPLPLPLPLFLPPKQGRN
ncbi:MAG: filamentous hemagglutinin family outer membrane protein [Rhodospirillales bacterium]|nr:filamentous hemagglutinin family outer membrane protein [Rhodospirillales bacterium]